MNMMTLIRHVITFAATVNGIDGHYQRWFAPPCRPSCASLGRHNQTSALLSLHLKEHLVESIVKRVSALP